MIHLFLIFVNTKTGFHITLSVYLDRERILGAGETLVGRLVAHDDGQRHPLLGEGLVDVYHLRGLGDRLLARLVGGVPITSFNFNTIE